MISSKAIYNTYTIGVKDDLSYQTTVDINNTTCVFEFGWNDRLNQRWFSVKTRAGNVLLPQTFIKLEYIYHFNINFDILGNYKTGLVFRNINNSLSNDVIYWSGNTEIYLFSLPEDQAELEKYNEIMWRYS